MNADGGRPPRLAEWLLARTLPRGVRGETIRGDLLEDFRTTDRRRARGVIGVR